MSWLDDIQARLAGPWPERDRILLEGSGSGKPLREAAVLIPLYVRDRTLWTLFTKRSDQVEHHKGQISFPGGAREKRDQTHWHTAIRETEEEIGVPRGGMKLLGALPKLVTVTDFEVSPFVGAMPYPVEFKKQEGEVEAIFEVPLSYLMNPEVVEEKTTRWKGRDVKTLVYHYRGHAIWGVTAFILSEFLAALNGVEAIDGIP